MAKTVPLLAAGASAAASPAEAVTAADFIISMVGDDEASRCVWLGEAGALAGRPPRHAIAIESSTLSRGWILELDRAVSGAGLRFIDGPVTGGPDGAAAGTLTVLAGTQSATLAAARPLLRAYAKEVVLFGPPGAGTAYKLIVNLIATAQMTALAEGMAVAERAGLDPALVAAALCKGTIASPVVQYLAARITSGNHDDVYFSARWRSKDAAYGLELAARVGQPAPTCTAAGKLFRRAVEAGRGHLNSSVIVEVLREMAGRGDDAADAR